MFTVFSRRADPARSAGASFPGADFDLRDAFLDYHFVFHCITAVFLADGGFLLRDDRVDDLGSDVAGG